MNGVENLIDFGNRSNFPRRSFFARRRGRERAVGGDNATHYVAQKMNGVENLDRFEQSKFSRIVHCAISEIWTIVENLSDRSEETSTPFHRPRRPNPPRNLFMERRGKLDRYGQFSTPFHNINTALHRQHSAFMERRGKFDHSGLIFHAVPQILGGFGPRPVRTVWRFPPRSDQIFHNCPDFRDCAVDNSGKFRLLDPAQIFHAVHFLRDVVRRVIASNGARSRPLRRAKNERRGKFDRFQNRSNFLVTDAHKPIPPPGKCVLLSARRHINFPQFSIFHSGRFPPDQFSTIFHKI